MNARLRREKENKYLLDIYSEFSKTKLSVPLRKLITGVVTHATSNYLDAAYSGAYHDGGADRMMEELKMFLRGVFVEETGIPKKYLKYFEEKGQ